MSTHQYAVSMPASDVSFTPVANGLLQPKCECDKTSGMAAECEECRGKSSTLQKFAANHDSPVSGTSVVHEVLSSPGQMLDSAARGFLEPRLGHDLSRVRVHADTRAAESADSVSAIAYTVGRDVVFGAGHYAPQTGAGLRLLAHELAHVVQQGNASASPSAPLQLSSPGDDFEQEADRVADAIMTRPSASFSPIVNGIVQLSRRQPGLQRTARFLKATPTNDINPAELIAENKIATAKLFLGETNFVLNKKVFGDGTAVRGALNTPGVGSSKRSDRAVDCWFTSVPDNEVSYTMKLLKKGTTWTHATDKKNVGDRFPTLKACKKGFGAVTFVVRDNKDLPTKIETHENQHKKDYETIFNNVLVPWNDKVTEAHKKSKKMLGKDDRDCEQKLYLASAGENQMAADIESTITNEINTRADDFHRKPEGSKPNISIANVDPDCTVVKADVQ
jgi:hypothetical protein